MKITVLLTASMTKKKWRLQSNITLKLHTYVFYRNELFVKILMKKTEIINIIFCDHPL